MDNQILDAQIKDAIGAHGMWKVKLKAAVTTGALPKPARDIACDDQCAFGKWLYGLRSDSSVSSQSHYKSVMAKHAQFHKIAGRVAAEVERGNLSAASAILTGSEYGSATDDLVTAMADWKRANR